MDKNTVISDKHPFDLSDEAMLTYKKMTKRFFNKIEWLAQPKYSTRLLATITTRQINQLTIYTINWGYETNPDKSILFEELKNIKFPYNLHILLDSRNSMSMEMKHIMFAAIEIIRNHYNHGYIIKKDRNQYNIYI